MRERDLGYRSPDVRYKPVPSGLLERWLGEDQVAFISERMRGWYGPPVAIANVPGHVYACGDGDFAGKIRTGHEANIQQWMLDDLKQRRIREQIRFGLASKQMGGFSSLSDLISEATTGGKKQVLAYTKSGIAAPAVSSSQWLTPQGVVPVAIATASTGGAGTTYTNASTGAIAQVDAGVGDTLHFVSWLGGSSIAQGGGLMLVDYLWAININYGSTSTTVTGAPTRYQASATAPGNFMSGNVTTVLGATAQNITVTYTDDAGNTGRTSQSTAIRASAAVNTIPHTAPTWYVPLAAGDTGMRSAQTIAFSAANSGNVDRMIAHPLAILPGVGVANQPFILDGINSAFNLERVYDGAFLQILEWMRSSTSAASYAGYITLVSG